MKNKPKNWREEIGGSIDFYLTYHKVPKLKRTMIKGNLLIAFGKQIKKAKQETEKATELRMVNSWQKTTDKLLKKAKQEGYEKAKQECIEYQKG